MGKKKQVLVVDDEPGIVNVLRIKLKVSGYHVVTTMSGAEAIEIIRKHEPDIVLLDILMPGLTGFDVLDSVRKFSSVPIIVFTARHDVVERASRIGATETIAKPFNPDHVVEKIESVLARTNRPSP